MADFSKKFGFVIALLVVLFLISGLLGQKVATYAAGLILLSMVLLNSKSIVSALDGFGAQKATGGGGSTARINPR